MIFSRKKRVTPKQMAADIWGAFVQIMQHEFDEAKKHDREEFIAEHGCDYDKKQFAKESSFLFTFLIYNEVENHFPEKEVEILKEFTKIFEENDMGFLDFYLSL